MKYIIYSLIINIIFALTSCQRRNIEDYADDLGDYARINIDYDWNNCDILELDEATLLIYKEENNKKALYKTYIFEPGKKVNLNLPLGNFSFIIINDKPGDFRNCRITNINDFYNVKFYLTESNNSNPILDSYNIYSFPEDLAIGIFQDFEVTEEMVSKTEENIIAGISDQCVGAVNITSYRVTRDVEFGFMVENGSGISKVEVIISEGYNEMLLHNSKTTNLTGAKYINLLNARNSDNEDNIYISGSYNSFGSSKINGLFPDDDAKNNNISMLVFITMKDKDKTVITTEFDITELYNNEGLEKHDISVNINDKITLPVIEEEVEDNNNSGMLPDVDEWGDDEIIDVSINK